MEEADYNNYYEYDNPNQQKLLRAEINDFKSSEEDTNANHQNIINNRASQPLSPMSPL